jgi:hypothetical protein
MYLRIQIYIHQSHSYFSQKRPKSLLPNVHTLVQYCVYINQPPPAKLVSTKTTFAASFFDSLCFFSLNFFVFH